MDEKPLIDTTIELKRESFEKFTELVKNQFEFGGVKYAHSDAREATDIISETFGLGWVLGTVLKYLLRFRNLRREKDLLKIACYMFIIWLKCGFHLEEKHDEDVGR